MLRPTLLAALTLTAATPARAQAPLSLGEAFRRADSAAFANRIAGAGARTQGAQATSALQGILPTVRAEGGYVRTDNPLAAFGYTLQQRGVSLASFSPSNLNYPAAVTNWNGGLVAEVPLINVDAWIGRSAAASATAAAEAIATLGGETMGTTWRVRLTAARHADVHALHAGIQARLGQDCAVEISAPHTNIDDVDAQPVGFLAHLLADFEHHG